MGVFSLLTGKRTTPSRMGEYSAGQKVCAVSLDADTSTFGPYSPRILQNLAQNSAFYRIFTAPGAVLDLFASIQKDPFQFLVSSVPQNNGTKLFGQWCIWGTDGSLSL